jgi:hypothetical protein
MKLGKLTTITGFLILAGISLTLTAEVMKRARAANPEYAAALAEQQKNVDKVNEEAKFWNSPYCTEPLQVKIGSITLSLPRAKNIVTGDIILKDGTEMKYMEHRCNIKRLNNVKEIVWPKLVIYDYKTPPKGRLYTYGSFLKQIEEARIKNSNTLLSNGVEKIIFNNNLSLFIMPGNLIQSYDKVPVAFVCSASSNNEFKGASNCSTHYLYKKDVAIQYTFFSTDAPLDGQVQADQSVRKTLKKLTIKEE